MATRIPLDYQFLRTYRFAAVCETGARGRQRSEGGGRRPRRVGAVRARRARAAGWRGAPRERPVRGARGRRGGRGSAARATRGRGDAVHGRSATTSTARARAARLRELGVEVRAVVRVQADAPRGDAASTTRGERTITTFGARLDPLGDAGEEQWEGLADLDARVLHRRRRRARCAARARRHGCSSRARARATRSDTASSSTRS